jgi:hypothetical protein
MAPSSTLGPPSADGWLARNAGRFHFVQPYSWEAWHYETPLALYGVLTVKERCAAVMSLFVGHPGGPAQLMSVAAIFASTLL